MDDVTLLPIPPNGQQITRCRGTCPWVSKALLVFIMQQFLFFVMFTPFCNDPHWVSFLGCSGPLAPRALTMKHEVMWLYLLSWSSNVRGVRFQLGNLSIECNRMYRILKNLKHLENCWLSLAVSIFMVSEAQEKTLPEHRLWPQVLLPFPFFHFAAFHFAGVKFYSSLHPSWTTVSITQQCSASPTVLGGV